jgi:hypothetical protein
LRPTPRHSAIREWFYANRRTVDLPACAVRALRAHRKRQLEEKLKSGTLYKDEGASAFRLGERQAGGL